MKTWHAVLLGGGLSLFGEACARPPSAEVMASVAAEQAAAQESRRVDYRLSVEGQPRLQLEADRLMRYEEGDSVRIVLEGTPVQGWLFTPEGDTSARLEAQRVTYDETGRRFVAEGKVTVTTLKGNQLWTDRLQWLEAQRRLIAPGFVRLVSPTEHVEGLELEADEQLESYRLRHVSGRVLIETESSP
jgi:lipopolysaccharide assembly outer membrane protein LptD (OstA)